MNAVLDVRDLRITLPTAHGPVAAVDGVGFTLDRGEVLGIVGESGCGKSLTALSLIGLLPEAARASGQIRLGETDLLALRPAALRRIRGGRIGMVFQDPMTALNPVMTIGAQLMEAIRQHTPLPRDAALARAEALLRLVRIADPATALASYPHHFSGGMRQRALMAIALAGAPDVLIADEPTTALDVTVQAQILDLLRDLRAELGMAVLLITHDLGVVAGNCDRVLVMYAGHIAEIADVRALFAHPAHPYTRGLMGAIPRPDAQRLVEIAGVVPPVSAMPAGCRFAPRCPRADSQCRADTPPLRPRAPHHLVACWHPHDV